MILQMAGIDFEKANLEIREVFSFQTHSAKMAMEEIKECFPVNGVILLSTCNRTEIYISSEEKCSVSSILCRIKKIDQEEYQKYITVRSGEEALMHLFQLSCGMKSRIFGEDQIITQVKNALFQARDVHTVDGYLERVFQSAVTTGKKVRSEVHLTAVKASVIEEMLKILKKEIGGLGDKKCLVIGNGEIGRLAAKRMAENGASVTMTVRSYKTRQVIIPKNCSSIDYKDRFRILGECDIVISATTSPHHTIKYEEGILHLNSEKRYFFVDLAVPRDFSSRFAGEKNIKLYNIDAFGGLSVTEEDNEAMKIANMMIREEMEKVNEWKDVKKGADMVRMIGEKCGTQTQERLKKAMRDHKKKGACEEMLPDIQWAAQKTVMTMLYDMKKRMPIEEWMHCLEVMLKEEK